MNVTSLGWRTDLMMRALEGSRVTDHGDHIAIQSPERPEFWWGNFLLLSVSPEPRDVARWLGRFAEVFPDAKHVALGIDAPGADTAEHPGPAEAGLQAERTTVLAATTVNPPPRPDQQAEYRPLAGDADWRQSLELRLITDEAGEPVTSLTFYTQRVADARRLTEDGHGAWFGAFADGRLVAQLGVFSDGSGIARYQNVETHPDWRRRGLAGTLVWRAGRWAAGELGAQSLVIIADPEAEAIRVYRSVGFADTEAQLAFQRPPYEG